MEPCFLEDNCWGGVLNECFILLCLCVQVLLYLLKFLYLNSQVFLLLPLQFYLPFYWDGGVSEQGGGAQLFGVELWCHSKVKPKLLLHPNWERECTYICYLFVYVIPPNQISLVIWEGPSTCQLIELVLDWLSVPRQWGILNCCLSESSRLILNHPSPRCAYIYLSYQQLFSKLGLSHLSHLVKKGYPLQKASSSYWL